MTLKHFIERPVLASVISIVIVIAGIIGLATLPIEQYPDIAPPTVMVRASYPGASAETIQKSVIVPLEQAINGVENMTYITSSAAVGSASVTVYFRQGTDPDMAAVNVQNKVSRATGQLPSAVTQIGVSTMKRQTSMVKIFSLYSPDDSYDETFLSNYSKINIEPRILRIPGVGEAFTLGADYSMRVWLKPDVMAQYKLIPSDVTAALSEQNIESATGTLGENSENTFQYTMKYRGRYETPEEFGQIVIRSLPDGEVLRLKDVADIELGSESYAYKGYTNGHPGVSTMIFQTAGSNATQVVEDVEALLEEVRAELPKGIEIAHLQSVNDFLYASMNEVLKTLIEAIILVVLVVYVFLQDIRSTLVPTISILVALVGTFAFLSVAGFSINLLTLFALVLAIGTVVDDAIIVVEAVQARFDVGYKSSYHATIDAMSGITSAIVTSTLVFMAVFIPVAMMGGTSGIFYTQFGITMAVAVGISAVNALTLSPALCALLLRHREPPRRGFFAAFNRWFDRRTARYTAFAPTLARHVARTGLFVAAMLAIVFLVWRKLPAGFLPEEDQGYLMVTVSTPEASSLQITREAMAEADELIRRLPEVSSTSFAAGFDMLAGIASTSSGIIFVKLADYADRKLSAARIAQQLTGTLYVAVPGAECYAFIPPAIPGLGVTSGISLEVQDLEGRGTAYLLEHAERLLDSLRALPSVASATTPFDADVPQRRLRIDREQALAAEVDLGTLYGELTTLLGGTYINNFTRFGKLYQTYMQAAPDYRRDERSLDNYYVASASGESVPVASLAEVIDTVGTAYVSQFNLYRSVSLTVSPAAGASTGAVMQQIERTAETVLPDDIGTAWSGVSYQEANASKRGGTVYLLAVVFVFLALAALYESWGLPLAILMSVPAAVLGAVCFIGGAHLLDPLFINDIYMQISLVMLIGLAAKNAILVVEYADRLFREKGLSLLEAAVEAARIRLRPIIMTAFSFILGVLPLVFASGVYSTARNIMGVALVGGMLFATLLGIFIYPALYYLVGHIGGFERRRTRSKQEEQA